MAYTATGAGTFRSKGGSLSEKLGYEFSLIKTETDSLRTANGKAAIKSVDITASMVSGTSLAANGVDLASGTNATFYAVFRAARAMNVVGMVTYTTEAYVKETTDAKIELKTEAGTPVTIATYTFPTAGQAVKTTITTTPTVATLAEGDVLDLVVTQSASSSGTGHAKVYLLYTIA